MAISQKEEMKKTKILLLAGLMTASLVGVTALNLAPSVHASSISTEQNTIEPRVTLVSTQGIYQSDLDYCNVDLNNYKKLFEFVFYQDYDLFEFKLKHGNVGIHHFGADDMLGVYVGNAVEDEYNEEWGEYYNRSGLETGTRFHISSAKENKSYSGDCIYIESHLSEGEGYITIPLEVYSNNEEGYSSIWVGSVKYKVEMRCGNNIYDDNGYALYQYGGVHLGFGIDNNTNFDRYSSFKIIDNYKVSDSNSENVTCAISPSIKNVPFSDGPCAYVSLISALKGIELAHGYNNNSKYSYSLIGKGIGEGSRNGGNNSFSKLLNNVRVSNNNYNGNSEYKLASEDSGSNYALNYTHNQVVKYGYHADMNGVGGCFSKVGVEAFLKAEKSFGNNKYVISYSYVCDVSSIGADTSYLRICEYINKNIPVQIADDDYEFPGENRGLEAHAMLAVGYGVTTKGVKEIIYDKGCGCYCAMPIDDVDEFWLLDIKYQEKRTKPFISWIPSWTYDYWADVEY